MIAFDDFERIIRDALTHLYDPLYEPPYQLYEVTGCLPEQGPDCVHAAIIHAIHDLEPSAAVPISAPARRFYELLQSRYVEGLTQDAAAQRLGISPRHLRGLQWKAVGALARSLWHRRGPHYFEGAGTLLGSNLSGALVQETGDVEDWASQTRTDCDQSEARYALRFGRKRAHCLHGLSISVLSVPHRSSR